MTTETEGAEASLDETLLSVEGDETTPGADAAAETVEGAEGEGEQPPPKPKQTAQERIDEVTRARRDAEREAEFWKAKALGSNQPEPKPAAQPQAKEPPKPEDFAYGEADTAYIAALVDYRVEQGLAQHAQKQAVETRAQSIEREWSDRQAEFAKTKPDYHAVIDRQWVCSPAMADAIKDSDAGPAIAYHLADNPDEARRINGLPPIAQIREIGRLEARLTPAAPTPTAKTVSNAPTPAPQVRGAGGKFKAAPDTDDFSSFDAAYD